MLKISSNTIELIADSIVCLIRQGKLVTTAEGGGRQTKNKRTEHWLAFIRRVAKDEIIFRKGMVKYFIRT